MISTSISDYSFFLSFFSHYTSGLLKSTLSTNDYHSPLIRYSIAAFSSTSMNLLSLMSTHHNCNSSTCQAYSPPFHHNFLPAQKSCGGRNASFRRYPPPKRTAPLDDDPIAPLASPKSSPIIIATKNRHPEPTSNRKNIAKISQERRIA
jgi:hypothetical protein